MKFKSIKEISNFLSQCFGEDMTYYECDTREFFMLNSPQNTPSFKSESNLNYNLAGQMGVTADFMFNGFDVVVSTSTSRVNGRTFKLTSTLVKQNDGMYALRTFSEYLQFIYTQNIAKFKNGPAWTKAVLRLNFINPTDEQVIAEMASAFYTIKNDVPQVLPTDVVGKLTFQDGILSASLTIQGVNVTPQISRWWFEPASDSLLQGQPVSQKNGTGDYQTGRTSWKIDNDFRNRSADTVIIPNRKFVAKCQLVYADSPKSTNYVMAELLVDQGKEPFKFF